MKPTPSQEEQILRHLKRATITPLLALQMYGCFRLVSSKGKRFAEYKLV